MASFVSIAGYSLDKRTSWVSDSAEDPRAILQKCLKSALELRLLPSAILDDMDTEHLRSWLARPNFSSGGRSEVSSYMREA